MELDYVFILTIFYARTQKFIVSFYGIHTRVGYDKQNYDVRHAAMAICWLMGAE